MALHGVPEISSQSYWFATLAESTCRLTNCPAGCLLPRDGGAGFEQHTPSVLVKEVVLDKILVKHWEYKSSITFKFFSLKILKLYE